MWKSRCGTRTDAKNASAAEWIVGTDGAHSTIRAAMDTKLVGSFKGQRFLLGDVDADYDCPRDRMQTFFTKNEGALLVFPMEGQRLRLIAEVPEEPLSGELAATESRGAAGDRRSPGPEHATAQRPLAHLLRDPARAGAGLPGRPRVPCRRRRPHPQPGRRPRHEHRHAGCLQPRMEAGAGVRRHPRSRGVAGQLWRRTPSHCRSRHSRLHRADERRHRSQPPRAPPAQRGAAGRQQAGTRPAQDRRRALGD